MISVITQDTRSSRNHFSILLFPQRIATLGSNVRRPLFESAQSLRHESFRVHTMLILAPLRKCIQTGRGKGRLYQPGI